MNPAFVNVILYYNSSDDENDENPQPNPNKDVVNNIYNEIEKEVEVIQNHNTLSSKPIQVEIVDPKLFSNIWGCFFF
jgi:hypothetical protein